MDNLTKVTNWVNSEKQELRYAPESNHYKLDLQTQEMKSYFTEGKKFYLSVEKSQLFYDKFSPNINRIHWFPQFQLPFEACSFIFEKPLLIKWIDKEGKEDVPTKLSAILIKHLGDTQHLAGYKIHLLFEEDSLEKENTLAFSNQYILFAYSSSSGNTGKPYIIHPDHYPCRHPLCMIGKDGNLKDWALLRKENAPLTVCQEISNRESLLETLFNLIDKIHESKIEILEKKTKKLRNGSLRLPLGWPWTKGNLPKDNYVEYLDGKRYVYDKDEIDIGSGTKHRYRYDVRRHPRIVNGHIVWIHPHQRGSGKYIPKIYKNTKTWYIQYFWQQAERLTKNRIIEIFIIKIIHLLHKLPSGKIPPRGKQEHETR